jgi:hypothetical protein
MPIHEHINAEVNVADGSVSAASFGDLMLVAAHTVNATRINGPYTTLAGLVADGFTLAATPAIHTWATTAFAQRPKFSRLYIGLRATGDANLVESLDAIEAANPATGYLFEILTRTTPEIMALATWIEARFKIAKTQSDDADMLAGTPSTAQGSELTFGGTPTDGVYSAQLFNDWTGAAVAPAITVTRAAGSPATNTDLADAMATALEANAAIAAITSPINNVAEVVEVDFTGLGNHYSWVLSAPAPGTLVAADVAGQVQNPGELLEAGLFTRTSHWYHDDDTEYLDAAIGARGLGFALDKPNGAGTWSYHRLAIVPATRLTDAQKANLDSYNVNYYSPVMYTSGQEEAGFTWPGVMASGRFIDVTTTIDLTTARIEEASMGVHLSAAAANRKNGFTDEGIQKFAGAWTGVLGKLTKAGHFADGAESPETGEITPRVVTPLASSFTPAEKATRRLTGCEAEVVLAGAINQVGDTATVGFSININL